MGYRGSCPAPQPELEERVGQGAPGRARRGCGSDSPCSPPPTWPPPCQPLRGSGAASCGSGRGYRRPRPGQLSSAAPSRHLAQGVMARLRVERALGGSRLGVTRAQRPAALHLTPLLLLLLLLLGGERSVGARVGYAGGLGGEGPWAIEASTGPPCEYQPTCGAALTCWSWCRPATSHLSCFLLKKSWGACPDPAERS